MGDRADPRRHDADRDRPRASAQAERSYYGADGVLGRGGIHTRAHCLARASLRRQRALKPGAVAGITEAARAGRVILGQKTTK